MDIFDSTFRVIAGGSLFLVMTGMGMTLRPQSFFDLAKHPKAAVVGLFAQIFILPTVAILIVISFEMPRDIAFGLILLSACPGGIPSNLVSFIVRADVVLSISLTAVNSIIIIFTMPIILLVGAQILAANDIASVDIPAQRMIIQLVALTVIPVITGMLVGRFFPSFALRSEKYVRIFSVSILLFILATLLIREHEFFLEQITLVGKWILGFITITLSTAYFISRLSGLPRAQTLTILIEVGMQNGLLAIIVATTLLGNDRLALFPSAYGMVTFILVSALALGYQLTHRNTPDT